MLKKSRRRRKEKYTSPWARESDLCAYFMDYMRGKGWICYPETGGFDILLVATDAVTGRFRMGDQIGVQAKLAPNLDVVYQALPYAMNKPAGPDFFAILVPRATDEIKEVTARLGIVLFDAVQYVRATRTYEPGPIRWMEAMLHSARWSYDNKLWVPPVQVDYAAGIASPRQLTTWKFKAVELCLKGVAANGLLTVRDFIAAGLSISRWKKKGWIEISHTFMEVQEDGKTKRFTAYQLMEARRPPHVLYPEIAAALKKGLSG